jgi:hypothetical protein
MLKDSSYIPVNCVEKKILEYLDTIEDWDCESGKNERTWEWEFVREWENWENEVLVSSLGFNILFLPKESPTNY